MGNVLRGGVVLNMILPEGSRLHNICLEKSRISVSVLLKAHTKPQVVKDDTSLSRAGAILAGNCKAATGSCQICKERGTPDADTLVRT